MMKMMKLKKKMKLLKLHNRKGYTLIEAILAFSLATGVIIAVSSHLLFTFRSSAKTKKQGMLLADVQLTLNQCEKILSDVDLIYVPSEDTGGIVEPNLQKVFFRHTYLPEGVSYDGTSSSLRSRWGCLWFKELDDEDNEINELRYFRSNEVQPHISDGLTWVNPISIDALSNIIFDYEDRRLELTLEYTRDGNILSKTLIFYYDKVTDNSTILEEAEEPVWPSAP